MFTHVPREVVHHPLQRDFLPGTIAMPKMGLRRV